MTSEPKLIPLSGEQLRYISAVVSDDARLGIVARGVWSTLDKTFFDVRVFHPGADSNAGALKKVYKKHEAEKKGPMASESSMWRKPHSHLWFSPPPEALVERQMHS